MYIYISIFVYLLFIFCLHYNAMLCLTFEHDDFPTMPCVIA